MTHEEIVKQFIGFGEHVHLIQGEDMDAVALHVIPVAWFIAMKSAGRLYVGIYEGTDHRLVGTRNLSFEEVTQEFIQEQVGNALAEQVGQMLDPDVLREFLSRPQNRIGQRDRGRGR